MALKRYSARVNGVDTILKLTEAQAEAAGLTEYRKVHSKQHGGAQNKARGADNKKHATVVNKVVVNKVETKSAETPPAEPPATPDASTTPAGE